jgi:hypothetical protein
VWDEIVRLLPSFESAVLTGVDADGYPYSVRCKPAVDSSARLLRVQLPTYASIQAGQAGLLCHSHDENLWNLRSSLVRGNLTREDGEWIFRPQRYLPGAGVEGIRGMVRFLSDSRRNAKRYLQKRGLSRPRIPWKAINQIKARIKEEKRSSSLPPLSSPDLLPWVSVLYFVAASIGAVMSIREDLPSEFAGRTSGHNASADFFRGAGTALSPGLAMLLLQSILTVFSTRAGKVGTAGVAGLTALGGGATVGMLGEPITYRVLSPKGFDPPKATLVTALIVVPSLMTVPGIKRLVSLRNVP